MIRDGVPKEMHDAVRATIYAQIIAAELALVLVDTIDDIANTDAADAIGIGDPSQRRAEILTGLSEMTLGIALREDAVNMLEAHVRASAPDDTPSV